MRGRCGGARQADAFQGLVQTSPWGGKDVGSQGDGTAQLVCREETSQALVVSVLHATINVHCTPLVLRPEG